MRDITRVCHRMMDIARSCDEGDVGEFRAPVVSLIQSELQVDGLVWGRGVFSDARHINLERSQVYGRDSSLFNDYQALAINDPVTANFLKTPSQLQMICTERFYQANSMPQFHDLVQKHQITHLALVGLPYSGGEDVRWMTLYRSDKNRPFDAQSEEKVRLLVSLALTLEKLRNASEESEFCPNQLAVCTPRERQMVMSFSQGLTHRDIAQSMHLSSATVRTHLRNAYKKLGISNKASLANLVALHKRN
jgi:DNA-binding CsgD family transcriptional regulator